MKRKKEKKKQKVTKVIKKNIDRKLITNTKKLKLKIQSRVWNFKNTMLKKIRKKKKQKKKQGHESYKKYIYMKFAFFF